MSKKAPLKVGNGKLEFSPGAHRKLIKGITRDFGPRFAPGAEVLYIGDTGAKMQLCEKERLLSLGIAADVHGKFPDVILYHRNKNRLFLVESVTSHGPINLKRHLELSRLFEGTKADLIFISAFPDRGTLASFMNDLSWETVAWLADSPDHLIHFNGKKIHGPYPEK
jgi:adenine-specific DNA-methyltransferase